MNNENKYSFSEIKIFQSLINTYQQSWCIACKRLITLSYLNLINNRHNGLHNTRRCIALKR